MDLNFQGQVAIVTGAGRGIGRDVALMLARRGAHVLVNDHGGSHDTLTPGSIDVAQAVVDEIVSNGGTAVADGSIVGTGSTADTIVGRAMDEFGRVDILVNNAGGGLGIVDLADGTDEQVEGVIRTNLLGPFMLLRRVWPIMQAQNHGRIVNMMSGTMIGMAGTGPYSAGKSGLIGLTNTAALEGASYGIHTNGVWPIALTRLAGDLTDQAIFDWMQQFPTGLVAEAIVYLCSKENPANGQMFSIGGGMVARNALYGNKGFRDPNLTAGLLHEHFDEARDLRNGQELIGGEGEAWRLT